MTFMKLSASTEAKETPKADSDKIETSTASLTYTGQDEESGASKFTYATTDGQSYDFAFKLQIFMAEVQELSKNSVFSSTIICEHLHQQVVPTNSGRAYRRASSSILKVSPPYFTANIFFILCSQWLPITSRR